MAQFTLSGEYIMENSRFCQICSDFLIRPDEPYTRYNYKSSHATYEREDVTMGVSSGCHICTFFEKSPEIKAEHYPLVARLRGGNYNRICDTRDITITSKTISDDFLLRFFLKSPDTFCQQPKITVQNPDHRSWSSLPISRIMSASTQDKESFKLIDKWVETCLHEHKLCQTSPNVARLPTRLIDISDNKPRLITTESSGLSVDDIRYATLSHRWNSSPFSKLISSNICQWHIAMELPELAPLFRDTIHAAKRLGLDYLWIDALCIIQSDEEDWNKEAAMMTRVYKGAYLNIGSLSSARQHRDLSKDGLFELREPFLFSPFSIELVRKDYEEEYFAYETSVVPEITWEPLLRRGWVFQERLLSPRTVYFGTQVTWECSHLSACEVFPEGTPGSTGLQDTYWSNREPGRLG
jgi:hypothetical protein